MRISPRENENGLIISHERSVCFLLSCETSSSSSSSSSSFASFSFFFSLFYISSFFLISRQKYMFRKQCKLNPCKIVPFHFSLGYTNICTVTEFPSCTLTGQPWLTLWAKGSREKNSLILNYSVVKQDFKGGGCHEKTISFNFERRVNYESMNFLLTYGVTLYFIYQWEKIKIFTIYIITYKEIKIL